MEWYIMNSSGVRSLSAGLGKLYPDGTYRLHDECSENIEEILEKIETDEIRDSVTKIHLLAEGIVNKDLLPLIKFASPDTTELKLILRLLGALSDPQQEEDLKQMKEKVRLNVIRLAGQVQSLFEDQEFVKALHKHVLELIEEAGDREMNPEGYEVIKCYLNLVRNVLYIVDGKPNMDTVKLNLLECQLPSIVVFSINCHSRGTLAVATVQLLTLLYKEFQWIDANAVNSFDSDYNDSRVVELLQCLVVQLIQGPLETLAVTLKVDGKTASVCELPIPVCPQRNNMGGLNSVAADNYLAWVVAFFVPYTEQVPVSVLKLRKLLSAKFLGYLVYQASMLSLQMFNPGRTLNNQEITADQESSIYLVFSAIDAILSLATSFSLDSLHAEECTILAQFYGEVATMKDLWQIVLLYIRYHDIIGLARSFLTQLVCLNHKIMSVVQCYHKMTNQSSSDILEHIKQFATPQVINQYAALVETYDTNTEHTNTCVFTMLCHICSDCQRTEALYTSRLLKPLGEVLYSLRANVEDRSLAKFVTDSFLRDLAVRPEVCIDAFINSSICGNPSGQAKESMVITEPERTQSPSSDWSDDEESELMSAYASWEHSGDVVKHIVEHLSDCGFNRNRQEVELMMEKCGLAESNTKAVHEAAKQMDEASIHNLVKEMCNKGNEDIICWIHDILLTASYCKAMPKDHHVHNTPLCCFSMAMNHDLPILPYNEKQEAAIRYDKETRQLLGSLHLFGSSHSSLADDYCIPYISHTYTAAELYSLAETLFAVGELPFEGSNSQPCSTCSSEGEEVNEKLKHSQSSDPLPHINHSMPNTHSLSNIWLMYMRQSNKAI